MGFFNTVFKSKNADADEEVEYAIPKAPFIYVNDPTPNGIFVTQLTKLIPKTIRVTLSPHPDHSICYLNTMRSSDHRDTVFIFADYKSHDQEESQKKAANLVRTAAIRVGSNFASINIHCDSDGSIKTRHWGGNHLDIPITTYAEFVNSIEAHSQAQIIYKWLFGVLTVKDTLFLIPDEEMQRIDTIPDFAGYEYCPLNECQHADKDAKIQFIVLIVNKPTIVAGEKITWQVADKTGVANFFFRWRGPSSRATWDWVLSLEPGQRKCLPRMPSVLVKENLIATVTKAPARVPGSVLESAGKTMKIVGKGLSKVGRFMKMGSRERWIPQADAASYLREHRDVKIVPSKDKSTMQVFTAKGTKTWSDADSGQSTLHDESVDAKTTTDDVQ